MKREIIILSDLDLKLLEFLKEENSIFQIEDKLDIHYSVIKKHLDRLINLDCVFIYKFGNFKNVKTNEKGRKILKLFSQNS